MNLLTPIWYPFSNKKQVPQLLQLDLGICVTSFYLIMTIVKMCTSVINMNEKLGTFERQESNLSHCKESIVQVFRPVRFEDSQTVFQSYT